MTLLSMLLAVLLLSLATSHGEPSVKPTCGYNYAFLTYTKRENGRFNHSYEDDNSYDDTDDGRHLDKIVGGSFASQGELPWQAAVLEHGQMICSAAIISEFWLISAAHCFTEHDSSAYTITVGDHRLGFKDQLEQTFNVKRIINHELFDWQRYDNDIALILIKATSDGHGIPFNNHIQPICLPKTARFPAVGTQLTVSGWGITSPSNQLSVILKKANMPVITDEACKKIYPLAVTRTVFCAGHYAGQAEACTGDSGAPAIYKEGGNNILLGIHASGIPMCGSPILPGIYTSIPAQRPWIDTTIKFQSSGSEAIIPIPRF